GWQNPDLRPLTPMNSLRYGTGIAIIPDNSTTPERLGAAAVQSTKTQKQIADTKEKIKNLEEQEIKRRAEGQTKQLTKIRTLKKHVKAKLARLETTNSKLDSHAKTIASTINHHGTQMNILDKSIMNAQKELEEQRAQDLAILNKMF
ncbi:MAG: hypothetical protein WCJ33_09725, partial [Pseudomonadota bacterium]